LFLGVRDIHRGWILLRWRGSHGQFLHIFLGLELRVELFLGSRLENHKVEISIFYEIERVGFVVVIV